MIDAKARYWSKIAIFASVRGGGPRRTIVTTLYMEKLEWCGYPMVKKTEDIFIHFERIHDRDRQTDGQTDTARWHRLRSCIASRGKNELNRLTLSQKNCCRGTVQ